MAAKKGSPVTVAYRHHDDRAEHQIGVVHDGKFVPFLALDDQTFEDAKSREAALEEAEGEAAGEEGGE